jgi:hypothetical protein
MLLKIIRTGQHKWKLLLSLKNGSVNFYRAILYPGYGPNNHLDSVYSSITSSLNWEVLVMIRSWMAALNSHYEEIRGLYPNDRLLLMFDIDGTILDMRYLVLHLLQRYDRSFQTSFFNKLEIADIFVHEDRIGPLLEALKIELKERQRILSWYEAQAWSSEAMLQAHRPFSGVLEVIRWFQMQPNTAVGLNTGRPEAIRKDTLRSLNKLGQEYKVHFSNDLLYMRASNDQATPEAKVLGVKYFQQAGYRVFAFIDNEPDNLEAISKIDPEREILLLHADTIFQSKRVRLPGHTISGNEYDLTELISKEALPQHIHFVWQGLNDAINLGQFLASNVYWGELDIRMSPTTGCDLILRQDSFRMVPLQQDETWLTLDDALDRLRYRDKGVLLDLKAGGQVIDRVLNLVVTYGFNGPRLWFNGDIEVLQEDGFKRLATAHPGAVVQCPIDFLSPLIFNTPLKARAILDRLRGWSVNRFSLEWQTPNLRHLLDQMDRWGFEININNVPDLAAFLQAVLLSPQSITSDFNFPQWRYYGRSGSNGYDLENAPQLVDKVAHLSR